MVEALQLAREAICSLTSSCLSAPKVACIVRVPSHSYLGPSKESGGANGTGHNLQKPPLGFFQGLLGCSYPYLLEPTAPSLEESQRTSSQVVATQKLSQLFKIDQK